MLQRLAPDKNATAPPHRLLASGFAAGFVICLPLFFKQNMGLPFLLVVLASVALLLAVNLLETRANQHRSR